MATIDDGGPAFPRPDVTITEELTRRGLTTLGDPGMSLRDWFAGQALVGLLAFSRGGEDSTGQYTPGDAASHAYRMADAMLIRAGKRADSDAELTIALEFLHTKGLEGEYDEWASFRRSE